MKKPDYKIGFILGNLNPVKGARNLNFNNKVAVSFQIK